MRTSRWTSARTRSRGARSLNLTGKEFEIIEYLLRHPGSVVSREMLASEVWKIAERATPLDNVIDVTMARLRRKIDDPFGTSSCTPSAAWGSSWGGARMTSAAQHPRASRALARGSADPDLIVVFSLGMFFFVKAWLYRDLDRQLGRDLAAVEWPSGGAGRIVRT